MCELNYETTIDTSWRDGSVSWSNLKLFVLKKLIVPTCIQDIQDFTGAQQEVDSLAYYMVILDDYFRVNLKQRQLEVCH